MKLITTLSIILFLAGCNCKNIEYRKFDRQGNLVENVRMGQVNVGFWFGLNDLDVDSEPLKVRVGSMEEYPDPNATQAIIESLKLINKIP